VQAAVCLLLSNWISRKRVVCTRRQSSYRLLLEFKNRLVAAKLKVRNSAIALSDATDRTSFREFSCSIATLWRRHYSTLLFIILINDLCNVITHSKCLLFADDVKMFRAINSVDDFILLQS
jgi:hypothetical protein